ncbi:hypothetical protein [Anthocerotibacter panamensis]|uniref:hypothetical protein n=1 Tax=Anthocerotibacter panamensis TaxID=2857077 RepID=UPI001C4070BF|nr:hypothetical protein [Anthocerotibacter panamensis]
MNFVRCAVLVLALQVVSAAWADELTMPSTQETLICTNPNLNAVDHPEDYTTCTNNIIPTVCTYWAANGDFTYPQFPKYMRAWNIYCAVYQANQPNRVLLPPPPGD